MHMANCLEYFVGQINRGFSTMTYLYPCKVSNSHDGDYEDGYIIRCCTVKPGISLPTVQSSYSRHNQGEITNETLVNFYPDCSAL